MARMQIGVAAKGGGEDTSEYDAVDLTLNDEDEERVASIHEALAGGEAGYHDKSFTIDDEDEEDEGVSSSSSSNDDGDDSDGDLSVDTDGGVVDGNDSVVKEQFAKSNESPLRRNRVESPSINLGVTRAVMKSPLSTPKHKNTNSPQHRTPRGSAPRRGSGTPGAVPPKSSFKTHLKVGNFPSLSLRKKDPRGKHHRLPLDENDHIDDGEGGADKMGGQKQPSSVEGNRHNRDNNNRNIRSTLVTNGNNHGNGSHNHQNHDHKKKNSSSNGHNHNRPFKVHDPAQFPLEQYVDAEYGIRNQRPPETYSYSSANPNSIDYEPRALRKMSPNDQNNLDSTKWERKIIFWGFVTAMGIMMTIMIVTVCSYRNHINVRPPPNDLENICSMSNIATKKGHSQCEDACKEAMCCMAMGSASCFELQKDVCSMYAPCGTIHSNYNGHGGEYDTIVPPPASNIEEACSDTSLVTESGFLECKGVCYPGICCFPSLIQSSLFSDHGSSTSGVGDEWSMSTTSANSHLLDIKSCASTHTHVCAKYVPCASLEGLDDVHGSAVDLVNKKCTPHNVQYAEGKDECENICQTRSCCFAESKKRNCRQDNEVWCDNFKACNYLLAAPDATSVLPGPSPGSNSNESLQVICKDPRNLSEDNLRKCQILCDPAVKCCFYLDDVSCHEQNVDCKFFSFCEGIANMQLFPPLNHGDGVVSGEDSTVVNELDLKEEDIIVETWPPTGGDGFDSSNIADVVSECNKDEFSSSCFAACSRYRCCFHHDYDPTSCHASSRCDKVQICKEHFLSYEYDDTSTRDKSPNDSYDDDFIDVLYYPGTQQGKRDPSPAEVNSACEGMSFHSNVCFLHCNNYRCCFEDDFDPISCHSSEFCDQIEVCEKIFDTKYKSVGEVGGGGDDLINDPPAEELCSIDNLMVNGGYDQCLSICAGKLCCSLDDDAGGCQNERSDCSNFQACSILLSDFIDADLNHVIHFDANAACSGDNISNDSGRRICRSICDAHKCCQDDSCASPHYDCSNYSTCTTIDFDEKVETEVEDEDDFLHGDYYTHPPESSEVNINTVCTANLLHAGFGEDTSFYTQTCLDLCKPAKCCRDDTCRHIDDYCVKYVACNNVWDLEDEEKKNAMKEQNQQEPSDEYSIQSLSQACSHHASSSGDDSAGREICKEVCDAWECCWANGDDNCFGEKSAECRTATTLCSSWIKN